MPDTSVHFESGTRGFRPPAVPLVAHSPYFDIWSFADRLTDRETTHWTGSEMPLRSMVRVDGVAYRVMGVSPTYVPVMPQTDLRLAPTQSVFTFASDQIEVIVCFCTPALPHDLDRLSKPVTYVIWKVSSIDGGVHRVQVYFDEGAEVAVNKPDQQVRGLRQSIGGTLSLSVGTVDQPILEKSGDDLRIDWGYAYLSVPEDQNPEMAYGAGEALRKRFVDNGDLPGLVDDGRATTVHESRPAMAAVWELGQVGESGKACWAMLAYDERYSIRYFDRELKPYWTKAWPTFEAMLQSAREDYPETLEACRKFDSELTDDLTESGGPDYERICSLAYRQVFAANAICDDGSGRPLMFSKECFSNGCMATVDVNFPEAPFLMLLSPTLMKASIVPALDYARMPRWKFPYAPHDLGRYPHATGQEYGGREDSENEQMPVEESGNLLIMIAALQRIAPDEAFVREYMPLLKKWADYLVENGLDPANQLCTSDMFGLLAHNVDLSIKAILGIGSYAYLADQLGDTAESAKYWAIARDFAEKWSVMAADDGRTRLAFNQPNTWGMKHNMIWDRILDFGLFPKSIGDAEVAWYKKVQGPYGLPNDCRTQQCLIDWAVWSIALADNESDWQALIGPIFKFVNETPDRLPLCDWFDTTNGKRVGFQARPVVGGLYIKMMLDRSLLAKWSGRDKTRSSWCTPWE